MIRKNADTKAWAEFEKYKAEQDRFYISDFDRSTKAMLDAKAKENVKIK